MLDTAVFFLAKNKFYQYKNGQVRELESQYLQKYRSSLAQIERRSAWKSTGTGAQFMGVEHKSIAEITEQASITAVLPVSDDKIIYAMNTDVSSGLYTKNPQDPQEVEGFIIRKNDMRIFETDYFPETGEIAASISETHFTRSLAMFHEDSSDYQVVTEGEVLDCNPCFSQVDDKLYYDSCGLLLGEHNVPVGMGRRSVLSLDLERGTIEEEASEENYDCFKPKTGSDGSLYYIKRPEQNSDQKGVSARDVAMMPGKVGKAMFGWLNFFTQRYSGESLSPGAAGPTKAKRKSEEEMFIEGNLVNAAQTLKENQGLKEKYPGIAPKTWELVRRTRQGELTIVKRGVLDFAVGKDGSIVYSNGKHLVYLGVDGKEELLCSEDLITNIQVWQHR